MFRANFYAKRIFQFGQEYTKVAMFLSIDHANTKNILCHGWSYPSYAWLKIEKQTKKYAMDWKWNENKTNRQEKKDNNKTKDWRKTTWLRMISEDEEPLEKLSWSSTKSIPLSIFYYNLFFWLLVTLYWCFSCFEEFAAKEKIFFENMHFTF